MKRTPRSLRSRIGALTLVALMLSGCLTVPTLLSDPLGSVGSDAAPISDVPDNRTADTLQRLSKRLNLPISDEDKLIHSATFGADVPAGLLPARYLAHAHTMEAPLRETLAVWAAFLGVPTVDDPRFYAADDLPLPVQRAVAALLMALIDATTLQGEAARGLSDAELWTLVDGLDRFHSIMDPADDVERAFAIAFVNATSKVDMDPILSSAQIVTSTVAAVLPALQDWADAASPSDGETDPRVADIRQFVERYADDQGGLVGSDRIRILSDALRMAASWNGLTTPATVPPIEPAGPFPLRGALEELIGISGIVNNPGVVEAALLRADGLPPAIQTALARIVLNQAAYLDALSRAARSTDPNSVRSEPTIALLQFLEAIRISTPILEAWALGNEATRPTSPRTMADTAPALAGLADLGRDLADPSTGLSDVIRAGSALWGMDAPAMAAPPLPARGQLADYVLDLYRHQGRDVDDRLVQSLREGAMALPPSVERNAARILGAQLDASAELHALRADLTPADLALLTEDSTTRAYATLQDYNPSAVDVQHLRDVVELHLRIRDGYAGPALRLAAAVDAAATDLARFVEVGPSVPDAKEESWWSGVVGFVLNWQFMGTAAAQATPSPPSPPNPEACPEASPLSRCNDVSVQDVWFQDPLLGQVIISGYGSTRYDSNFIGRDGAASGGMLLNRQVLTIDLGGNDVYSNNAGGAFFAFLQSPGGLMADPFPTAVALDMGGKDEYRLPPTGYPSEGIQGSGVGGIGFLWDHAGNDRYTAKTHAQGFGGGYGGTGRPDSPCVRTSSNCVYGPFGVGVLLDREGQDAYFAQRNAQGASTNPDLSGTKVDFLGGTGILVDLSGGDHYELAAPGRGQGDGTGGLGLLLDAGGDDVYRNGTQGNGAGGVGILVDVGGDDTYSRKHSGGSSSFSDAECWMDKQDSGASGAFLDLGPSGCAPNLFGATVPAAPTPSGTSIPSPAQIIGGQPGFILNLPGVFALGDSGPTVYPAANNYALQLDLGGDDDYFNAAGGFQSASIDLGGDDDYVGATNTQGAKGGVLVDLDGNDEYRANSDAQASDGGILFDGRGNDVYVSGVNSQASAFTSLLFGTTMSVLLDVEGDDSYSAPQQAMAIFLAYQAMFLDLRGEDRYQPTGQQAVPATAASGTFAVFVDAEGFDHYVGTPAAPSGPDFSDSKNGRLREYVASPSKSVVTLFWDRDTTSNKAAGGNLEADLAFPDLGFGIGDSAKANTYLGDYALLIEPGGDDVYHNNAGSTVIRHGVQAAVGASGPFIPGLPPTGGSPTNLPNRFIDWVGTLAGIFSVSAQRDVDSRQDRVFSFAAILIDLAGDDRYDSTLDYGKGGLPVTPSPGRLGNLVQGAGFLGAGILVDTDGDDTYRAQVQSQGAAIQGAGILWDRLGDDDYGFDPIVVRHPNADNGLIAWEELVAGDWVIQAMDFLGVGSNILTVNVGPGPCRNPVVRGDWVFYEQLQATGRWTLESARISSTSSPAVVSGRQTYLAQRDLAPWTRDDRDPPAVGGSTVIWTDYRNGNADIYVADSNTPNNAPLKLVPEPNGTKPSNQTRAAFADDILVWQDDASGSWDVYGMDLVVRKPYLVAGGPGDQTNPQGSASSVAWQTRTGPDADWDLGVVRRDINGAVHVLDQPGDQTSPKIHRTGIVYHDIVGGLDAAMQYDPLADVIAPLLPTAGQLDFAVDRSDPFAIYWVSPITQPANTARPHGSPFAEIYRQRLGPEGAVVISTKAGGPSEAYLEQGAVWTQGIAILLDEAGIDHYTGAEFSQGGAFNPGIPRSTWDEENDGSGDPGPAYGVLIDLEGNDAYRGLEKVQGVLWGADFGSSTQPEPSPQGLPTQPARDFEANHKVGLLLDMTGSDLYVADRFSQGYGGYEFAVWVAPYRGARDGPAQDPGVVANPAFGIFVDGGGVDDYDYPAQPANPENNRQWGQGSRPDQPPGGVGICIAPSPLPCVVPVPVPVVNPGPPADAINGEQDNHGNREAKGGIGIDTNTADTVGGEYGAQSAAQSGVQFNLAASPIEGGRVRGTVGLTATMSATASRTTFDVKRIEIFTGGRLLGYAAREPCALPCTATLPWNTQAGNPSSADGAWADGVYEIVARAHVGLQNTNALGYIDKAIQLTVDNPSKILSVGVSSLLFSPHPFDGSALEAPPTPGLPTVSFRASPDLSSGEGGTGNYAMIRVKDAAGNVVNTLRPFSPLSGLEDQRTWNGYDDATIPTQLPTGVYRIEVSVSDRDWQGVGPDPRMETKELLVALDATPPRNTCIRAAIAIGFAACDTSVPINRRNAIIEGDAGRLPILIEPGNPNDEILATYLFTKRNDGPWESVRRLDARATTIDIQHLETVQFVALLQDVAGNLECAPVSCVGDSVVPFGPALSELGSARDRRLAVAAASTYSADLVAPIILAPKYVVSGSESAFTGLPRVGATADLAVRYDVREEDSCPPSAAVQFAHETVPDLANSLSPVQQVTSIGATQCERFRAIWTGWAGMVQTWPEGLIIDEIQVEDAAGNPAFPLIGQILYDRTAPLVTGFDLQYPGGRRHAIRDDQVTLTVRTHDPAVEDVAIAAKDLLVLLDASAISSEAGADRVRLVPEGDPADAFTAVFTVSPDFDIETLSSRPYEVMLTVTDTAANTRTVQVPVVLGEPRVGLVPLSEVIGIRAASFEWSAARDAQVRVEFGPTGAPPPPFDEFGVQPGEFGFEFPNLQPDTRYVYRLVATTPDGAVELSSEQSFRTDAGIELDLTKPMFGDLLSGLSRIEGQLTSALETDEPFSVSVFLEGDLLDGGSLTLAQGRVPQGRIAHSLITNALPDGTYSLRLRVEVRDLSKEWVIGGLVIDNQPPTIVITSPVQDALVSEALAQIVACFPQDPATMRPDAVIVRVDGEQWNDGLQVAFAPKPEGGGCAFLSGFADIPEGVHGLAVTLEDVAGNQATGLVRVLRDKSAPSVEGLSVQYEPEAQAARPGSWVRLEMYVEDEGSVARATVNTSAIGGMADVQFMMRGTAYVAEFQVPEGTTRGASLPVTVTDRSGHESRREAIVTVDATPPTLRNLRLAPAGMQDIGVSVDADEPVTSIFRLAADDGSKFIEAKASPSDPAVLSASAHGMRAVFGNLTPGKPYILLAEATDHAGWRTTSEIRFVFAPVLREPTPIMSLGAELFGSREVRLDWQLPGTNSSEGLEFIIQRAQDGRFEALAQTTQSYFIDADASPGHTYQYIVNSRNFAGLAGESSAPVSIVVPLPRTLAASVIPRTGTPETDFAFRLDVRSAASQGPTAWLLLGGSPHRMVPTNSGADCRVACGFEYRTRMPALDLSRPNTWFHMELLDGSQSLRVPETLELDGPIVFQSNRIQLEMDEDGGDPAPIPQGDLPVLLLLFAIVAVVRANRRRQK